MTTNKNTIATKAIVIISKRVDEEGALLTGVKVGVEVADERAVDVELKGVFTGRVTVWDLLHPLVSP